MKSFATPSKYPVSPRVDSTIEPGVVARAPIAVDTAANDDDSGPVHDEDDPLWVVTAALAFFLAATAAVIALG